MDARNQVLSEKLDGLSAKLCAAAAAIRYEDRSRANDSVSR
jgi:hypothetical protein